MWASVFLVFLCVPIWSCFMLSMLCFLKMAMTPVMLAAGKGHTGVVHMLAYKVLQNCCRKHHSTHDSCDSPLSFEPTFDG